MRGDGARSVREGKHNGDGFKGGSKLGGWVQEGGGYGLVTL